MPLVRVTTTLDLPKLAAACSEIVPAAFNSPQGRLSPGSIEFLGLITDKDCDVMSVDTFVEIEAFDYPDRATNLDERCSAVRQALKELFPNHTFAVWGKLVKAGWSSDSSDPEFTGDMSMEAALERAKILINLPVDKTKSRRDDTDHMTRHGWFDDQD